MKKFLILFFLIIPLMIILQIEIFALSGQEVKVYLKNDSLITSELISVRDSSIIIDVILQKNINNSPYELREYVLIKNDKIKKLIIPGSSNVLKGGLIGGILGAGITLKGFFDWSSSHSLDGLIELVFGPVLLAMGAGIGCSIGDAYSHDEIIIEPFPGPKINLNPFAKYEYEEPDEIKAIK
jgi:hypothetical protein